MTSSSQRARRLLWRQGLCGLLLLAGCLAPLGARAGRLAVFRIDPLGVDPQIVSRLEGLFRLELGRLADAAMPSPGEIQGTLARHPQLQNCTGEVGCLVKIGRLLQVEQVISGNVGGLGGDYVVNLKLVDVAQEKELRKIQEPIRGNPDQLIEAVRVAAYALVAPERLRGALEVLADQPGADVYLNGELVGKTPLPAKRGLPVGSYTLRLTKAGYTDVLEPVLVRFQKTAQVVVKMEAPRLQPRQDERSKKKAARPMPWFTRWWFWTTVGVVSAGLGAAIGYGLAGTPSGINCDAEPGRCGH